MGTATPKQYLPLVGKAVIVHTLERLARARCVAGIVVVLASHDKSFAGLAPDLPVPVLRVEGGSERLISVRNGLRALADSLSEHAWVMVHDAVRPCITKADIERLFNTTVSGHDGGLLAMPVRDTLKRADTNECAVDTVSRAQVWHAFTPQMFRRASLLRALNDAIRDGAPVTDEAQAMERAGVKPKLVLGRSDNIKVTTEQDLSLATLYLRAQDEEDA